MEERDERIMASRQNLAKINAKSTLHTMVTVKDEEKV